jgi:hypothetical protein
MNTTIGSWQKNEAVRAAVKMLFFLAVIAAILSGCGQEKKEGVTFQGPVYWMGFLDSDPSLLAGFNSTLDCLEHYGPIGFVRPQAYPFIIVPEIGLVNCEGAYVNGCYDGKTGIIYVTKDALHSWVLSHEIIHWATGSVDHSPAYFATCQVDEWWK